MFEFKSKEPFIHWIKFIVCELVNFRFKMDSKVIDTNVVTDINLSHLAGISNLDFITD